MVKSLICLSLKNHSGRISTLIGEVDDFPKDHIIASLYGTDINDLAWISRDCYKESEKNLIELYNKEHKIRGYMLTNANGFIQGARVIKKLSKIN